MHSCKLSTLCSRSCTLNTNTNNLNILTQKHQCKMTFSLKIWNSCPFSSFYTTFIDVFKLGTKYTTKILINYTSISSFWENQKPKSWHFIFFIYTINYRWMVTEIYNNVTFLWAIKIIFLPESRFFFNSYTENHSTLSKPTESQMKKCPRNSSDFHMYKTFDSKN